MPGGKFCLLSDRRLFSRMLFAVFLSHLSDSVSGHTILEEYSCDQSDVQYGVALRGGEMAGIFRDRGPVKNMQECMHLCCTSKKCDVAMMHKSKCYEVQCFNETVCEGIPADDRDLDLQIAHISSKGTGSLVKGAANDSTQFDADAKCPHNEIMYNVKLKAGLRAGKFTDIGKVKSIKTCVRYCCDSKVPCDLAFMLEDRCYLVKCYSEDRCNPLPSPAADFSFKQKMAFVAPWLYEKGKKLLKLPSGKISHHVQCTMGKLYSNTRLLAGKYAGHFTEVGRVSKSHRCNRLCCEDPSCDVAYMVGPSCFLVKCNSEAGCRTVPDLAPAEAKSQLPTSLQFVVKRKFGVMLDDQGNTVDKSKMCNIDGQIHNKTILKAGMIAGKLTAHKGVKDIKKCVEKCCAMDQCHVAMMLADHCYSVFCTNTDYCSPKPAPEETHHTNPTVAYVKRGDIASAPVLQLPGIAPRFQETPGENQFMRDESRRRAQIPLTDAEGSPVQGEGAPILQGPL